MGLKQGNGKFGTFKKEKRSYVRKIKGAARVLRLVYIYIIICLLTLTHVIYFNSIPTLFSHKIVLVLGLSCNVLAINFKNKKDRCPF